MLFSWDSIDREVSRLSRSSRVAETGTCRTSKNYCRVLLNNPAFLALQTVAKKTRSFRFIPGNGKRVNERLLRQNH